MFAYLGAVYADPCPLYRRPGFWRGRASRSIERPWRSGSAMPRARSNRCSGCCVTSCWARLRALAAVICLAACVAPPAAPTIPVAPGPSKTLDTFGADQAACQQYAAAQISPAVAAANNQAVGGALLGAALGAGLGAGIGAAAGNAGKGAAIGAASGGALGIIGNADGAPYAQESLQQQYDIMYGQCMAAHGNSVASLSPPPGVAPYSGKFSTYSGGSRP